MYGEILGVGTTASPAALNDWPAEPSGLASAMRLALEDADLDPRRVDAVFATANGSPRLDALEAAALADVFGPRALPVVSLKGAIGESGAAGAAAIAGGLLTLARGVLPPTVGFAEADPACPVAVSGHERPAAGRTFLANSVASGGTNCSVVIRADAEGPQAHG